VLAIDIDPLSLEVANDNLQRNKLKSRVRLQLVKENSALRLSRKKFELILANLFEAELKKLAEDFAKHLKNKGYLAISGILPEQASPLMKVYKKLGMRILQKKEQNKWIAILMRKN
jgi:ribosomal protein L11 methyltransferase